MVGSDSTISARRLRVLLAGADAKVFPLALSALNETFRVEHRRVAKLAELHDALRQQDWDVLLCDLDSADCGWREVLALLTETGSDLMVVALTGQEEEGSAAEVIASGARAVLGPTRLGRLAPIVRRELEDIRRRRLRELKALLHSSPDPMLVVDTEGRIRNVNRLLEELLGYSETDLVGQPVELLVPEHLRARHVADRARYAAAPAPRPMGVGVELAARHKDGAEIPVEISLGPVRLGGEQLVCCGLRDLRERRRAEKLLRAILEGTAAETGEAFLRALAKNLALALEVRCAFVSEIAGPNRARALAFWNDGAFSDRFEYPLARNPCEAVIAKGELVVPGDVRSRFPGYDRLKELNAESFFGLRLQSAAGAPLGVLAIVDVKPLADETLARTIMHIFASRAAAELERMCASAALAGSEARFRDLAELSADWYWEQDENFRFVDTEAQPTGTTPLRAGDYAGRTRWEVHAASLTPDEWAAHRRQLEAHEEFRDLEYERRSRDGTIRWVSVSGRPIFDEEGRFRGYRGIAKDITARKHAEQVLRELLTEQQAIFNNTLAGIVYARNGRIVRCNRAFAEFLGYRPEDLIDKSTRVIHPSDEAFRRFAELSEEALAREGRIRDETQLLRSDGGLIWVAYRAAPVDARDPSRGFVLMAIDITERKRADDALRASEERFRATFEQAAVGVAHVAPDGCLLRVNRKLCEIVGYPRDELLARTFQDITHPDDLEKDLGYVRKMLAREIETYSMEKRYRRKDGSIVWVNLTVSLVWKDDAQPDYFISVVEDISERKRSEDTTARLGRILDQSSNEIYVFDAETLRFVQVNEGARRNLGYSMAELRSLTPLDLKPEFDAGSFGRLIEPLRRGLQPVVIFETTHRRKDGSLYPVEVRLQLSAGEQPAVFVAIIQDITERRRTAERLREAAARMTLIAENVPAMIAYTDADFRFRYANRQFIDFYAGKGVTAEGRPMAEVLGAATFAAVRPGVERALAGETVRYDVTRRRHDGKLRHVDVTLVPHREDGGRVLGVYTFVLDVTESRRSEEELRESVAQRRLVVDNVPALICFFDADYRIGYANRKYAEFYTGKPDPVEGRALAEVIGEEAWAEAKARIDRALAGETITEGIKRRRRTDGSLRDLEISLVPHRDESGQVQGVYALILDVTRRRRAEERLRLRERAIESSVNSVMITRPSDKGQEIVYVNPAFERITGYAAAEVIGRSPKFLHGDDRAQDGIEALRKAAREGRETTALLRNYRKDGTMFWNELRVAPVHDDAGRVTHFVGIASDITERVRYQEEIERNANYDSLTGLPNRNLLNDRLAQAIVKSGRSGRPVGVVYVDLDHLKRVNDSLGHPMGDRVIAALGARLAGAVRTGDTVARMGGDEFVIVLADLKREDDAATVAAKVLKFIGAPLRIEPHEFVLTASAGVALYPKDGADAATLLRNADTALYRAKEDGRDCFRFFAAEMNERVVRFLTLEHDLRRALDLDEFRLQYQPIVRLASGLTVGAEALIRWRRPDGGMVPPAQFIPVAEESGLIVPIGRWVLETAAHQAAEWNRRCTKPLFVSVNLSARQFRDPKLIDTVRTALERARLDPALLKLEITETAVMQDVEGTERWLGALKDIGVQLSIDDFGTGYSSLAYLKRFPIDSLKIDRSFVRALPADRDDLAISRAVIDLARGLELDVIAEGIETHEQAKCLEALGCGLAQGYLFGRPADPAEFVLYGTRRNKRSKN